MKVKLLITSNVAKPGSVGAVLGQRGINSAEFCKRYNHEASSILALKDGFNIPVQLNLDEDGDYKLQIGYPQISWLLKKNAGFFSLQLVYELATLCLLFEEKKIMAQKRAKLSDIEREQKLQQLCQQILGTARTIQMVI